MRTIKRRIVSAFLVSADNKILLGKKRQGSGSVYEDCWHKPGGGVEPGESDKVALRREILEETGIDIGSASMAMIDNSMGDKVEKTLASGERVIADMQFNNYKVELGLTSSELPLKDTEELISLTWFGLDELHAIKLTPPMNKLLTRLGSEWLPYGKVLK